MAKNFKSESLRLAPKVVPVFAQSRKEKKEKKRKRSETEDNDDKKRKRPEEVIDNKMVVEGVKSKEPRAVATASEPLAATAPAPQRPRLATVDGADDSVMQILERIRTVRPADTQEEPTPIDHSSEGKAASAAAAPTAAQAATPAEPAATGKAAGSAEPRGPVNLAGKEFADRKELVEYVRAMQARLEEESGGKNGKVKELNAEDRFLFFHLVMYHPTIREKLRAPVKGFRYGQHHSFKNNCFMVLYSDGTEEPVSYMKCIKAVFTPGASALSAHVPDEREAPEAKKPKRSRQEGPAFREPSRSQKPLSLIMEDALAQGAPQAQAWDYPLMDEVRRSFAGYLRCPFQDATVLQGLFDKVRDSTAWNSPKDPRSGEPLPRKTAWMVRTGCTCSYRYGGVDVKATPFTPEMLEVMRAFMPFCGLEAAESWPNSCNLNLYEDGSHSVGWHADDERLFQARERDARIISASLGEARTFELRAQEAGEEGQEPRAKYRMRLGSGDICTMEGLVQKHYHHRVPKEDADGPRINLTWRWITHHRPDCPVRAGGE